MTDSPEQRWRAFEALAKRYPHDDGVRLTQDLARWLIEERERLRMPVPPELKILVAANGADEGRDSDQHGSRPGLKCDEQNRDQDHADHS